MAANMPVWISKTLGFLSHPRGPQTTSALPPSHHLEQVSSSYSKALPPLPRKAYLERQRARATKRSRRSHTRSPPWDNNGLEERAPIAFEKPTTTVNYEDEATQTLKPQDVQHCEPIRTTGNPDFPSWNGALMENSRTSCNTQSSQAPNPSQAFEAVHDSYDQQENGPEPGSKYATTKDLRDNVDSGAISVTSTPLNAVEKIHAPNEHGKASLEMPQQSPARSYYEDGSVPSFDNKAAVEVMDVDSQSMQNPEEYFEGQELLARNTDMTDGPPYTEGEAQIVRASDGSKDCLALLLTHEMVTKISQIATRSRRLEFIKRDLRKMKHEVESEKNMIEYKTDAIQDTNDQAKIAQINEEIGHTRERLAAAVKCVDAIEDEILTLTDNLAFSREQCQEMFEDVLVREDLLEVPDPKIAREVDPTMSCGSNYNVEQSANREGQHSFEVQAGEEEAISVQLEDVVRRTAKEDFEEKRNIFYTLDEAFEHRQENLAAEKAEYLRRVQEGTCDLSQTAFDLLALEDFQKLTANLRHAEEEFEDAFKRAKQLGVLDEHDAYYQQSVFSEWSGGYPMSMEHAMVDFAPIKRIGYWQDRIDESQGTGLEPWGNPELEPEDRAMEDCDIRSVAISDSWSCVDWTRNRRRIDRWRELAGRDR
ncbi:MAG: hypothetical protein Q9226_007503 [Calogaya cf. arnoldii]